MLRLRLRLRLQMLLLWLFSLLRFPFRRMDANAKRVWFTRKQGHVEIGTLPDPHHIEFMYGALSSLQGALNLAMGPTLDPILPAYFLQPCCADVERARSIDNGQVEVRLKHF